MSRLNAPAVLEPRSTHEGARAWPHTTAEQSLRRSVLSCMLWENEFYEDGESVAQRIAAAADAVPVEALAALAIEARSVFNLRHVPLLLLTVLARRGAAFQPRPGDGTALVAKTIAATLQRADELSEFLAVYAKANSVSPKALKSKLSAQVKRGLASAFGRFDEYQLAKYDHANAVRLRDVLFLCHAKPCDGQQEDLWKRLIRNELAAPDTWEVALSCGADKKATFERLLRDGKLGYLALLRNLRNMEQAGCNPSLVRDAILARRGAQRVLPFRFIAAAKAAPKMEASLDEAMVATLQQRPKLPGKTLVVIDVSGSMYGSPLSQKSDMTRDIAACALGAIARELCENPAIYATAGSDEARKHATAEVPARRGMALVDAIHGMCSPLGGGGIFLKQVMDFLLEREKHADRVIVITDEQDCGVGSDDSPLAARAFGKHNYIVNVASAKNGIGYGKWTHVDGFSERVFDFIAQSESVMQAQAA